jgi:hypothetical protein
MKRLDPSYSFEKEPSKVQLFGDKLANESARSAPAPVAPAAVPAPAYAPRAETHVAPPPAPEVPHKSGHTLLWVVLGLVILGIGGWFLFSRTSAKDKQEDEARVKALRQDQLKQANSLFESVKPLRLDMRMASPPNAALLSELDDAEKSLIDLIERLSKAPVSQREVDAQSDKLASLRRRFEGKADPAPQAEPANDNSQQTVYQGSTQSNGFGMPQQVNAGMGGNTVYQPAGYPQQGYPQQGYPQQGYPQMMPQPMYVEQESGLGTVGGLIAGVALGEMMAGGHHDREIIHEVREVPVYEDRPSGGSRRDDSSSDIDFGNDNSSNGSSGGDVDFSSDDN